MGLEEVSNMNTFSVVFLCIQACLVQNVFGQCTSRAAVVAEPGLISPGLAPYGLGSPLAYGGLGGWEGIAPAAAAIAPGLAGPYGLASSLGYNGLGAAATPFGYRAGLGELAYPAALGWADETIAAYGGVGEGNVAVAGELPVAGTTAVAGQVPIMGAVKYGGPVNAAGAVTITGQCACGGLTDYLL